MELIRNAADAHELLGDQLETRVAHKTKLVRVTDKVAALKLHDTFIVWYGTNGCLLNVADWNTRTTWRRINDFTPATPRGHQLLRYIDQPNGDAVLYEPDLRLDPEGMVTNPMLPTRQRRIEDAASSFLSNSRRYARTAVEAFDSFSDDTCVCTANLQEQGHYLAHIEANDPVLPARFQREFKNLALTIPPDEVVRRVRTALTAWLTTELPAAAIYAADPNYKFLNPNVKETP